MSKGLKAFLAELDAIHAAPDEDLGAYIHRMKRSRTDHSKPTSVPARASDQREASGNRVRVVGVNESSIVEEKAEHEDRRTAPGQSFSFRPNAIRVPETSAEYSKEESESPGKEASPGHDGDTMSIVKLYTSSPDMNALTSPPRSPRIPSSPSGGKRKLDFPSGATSSKRRGLSSDASADMTRERSEPPSPILSFSATEQPVKVCKALVVDQGPQLNLVPLAAIAVDQISRKQDAKPTESSSKRRAAASDSDSEACTSSSGRHQPKSKRRAIQPEPSGLLVQMKERVSRHAAPKTRPKTVQLAKTDPGPTGSAAGMEDSEIIDLSSPPSSRAASPTPLTKLRKAGSTATRVQSRASIASTSGKGKKKTKLVSPFVYAENLMTEGTKVTQGKASITPFLVGYNVFYTGGDRNVATEATRKRMDLLVRLGANLIPRYDPAIVSHVISDASPGATEKALGDVPLSKIPKHIPTVKWSWVTMGMNNANHLKKAAMDEKLQRYLLEHAAFSTRLDAGLDYVPSALSKVKGKSRANTLDEEEFSMISDFTQDRAQARAPKDASNIAVASAPSSPDPPPVLPSPSVSPRGPELGRSRSSRITLNQDPLAEFIERAKVEQARDEGFLSAPSSDVEDHPSPSETTPQKSRWLCDTKEAVITSCANQDVIDKLSELMELHKAKPGEEDRWRAFAYSKAVRALKHHPTRIKGYEDAKTIKGVGEKTAKKIAEILETGDLRRIDYEKTEDVEIAKLFQGIYGVGRQTAYQWYTAGLRTLEDLKNGRCRVKLSSAQEVGLKFYDDINDRMPRSEAEAIYKLIEPIALSIDPKLFIKIMGSFRRGKASCGDIDILITRPVDDGKTHSGVLPRLFEALHSAGILTEDLAIPDDPEDLEATYRGLCRIPTDPNSKRRRIDILCVPWESRGGALLYYTGDDIFNRAMRYKANRMGYSLNQRGLYAGVVRDPRNRFSKVSEGHIIASETEEEIFKILGVPWQEPHERVRG